jgi:SAM-dependent methyltransferase
VSHAHHEEGFWRFVERWLPGPPARVLDVGCGAGATTRRLRELGHEALGVDPEAPNGEGFERVGIESFDGDGWFDAALVVRSLHHVGRLDAAVDAIANALKPGSRLVIFEFAIEAIDDRARSWSADHGLAAMPTVHTDHDLIPLWRIRGELARRFESLLDEPEPYLAREAGRVDLEAAEAAAIEAGELAAAGARLVYARR